MYDKKMRQKEKEVRFEKKIEFRVTEGMFKYLQDFADNEGGDISKIVRGIIEIHMAEKAEDKYYLMDKIKEMIRHHEAEIEKLKGVKEELVSKR